MIPKRLLINFDSLKVGQTLFDSQIGEVEIEDLKDSGMYPIICRTKENGMATYTKGGYRHKKDSKPALFKSNPFEAFEHISDSLSDKMTNVILKTDELIKKLSKKSKTPNNRTINGGNNRKG